MHGCAMRWMIGLLLILVLVVAGTPFGSGVTAAASHGEEEDLHHAMETIDRSMRKLRASLNDEAGDADSLEAIGQIQGAVVIAKRQTPHRAEDVAAADRSQFVTAFRKELATLLGAVTQLEIALLDGEREKAIELYDAVKAMRDPAHEKFADEDE